MKSRDFVNLKAFQPGISDQIQIKAALWIDSMELFVEYRVYQQAARIQWPDGSDTATMDDNPRRDGLWRQTCFEVFLSPAEATDYWELNFSPLGYWNCYRFDNYREGGRAEADAVLLDWECRLSDAPLPGFPVAHQARFRVRLPGAVPGNLQANVAVIVCVEGRRYHFALAHPAGAQPDFHQRQCFIKTVHRRDESCSSLR